MSHYSIKVSWSNQDGMFVAVCPALGDLSALGETAQEAVSELEQAIELALETYESEGWPIPNPDVLEEYSGQFRLRLPRSLHASLSHEAQRQGVSLNSLVTSILAQAQGVAETQIVLSEQVCRELSSLRTSLASTMRDVVVRISADSSNQDMQQTLPRFGSHSSTLSLVKSVG